MRVIAGRAKKTILETPKGMETRPTTDRIKETLFNMIQMDLADSYFLDLFSGSGAIGIEALSRGAKKAVFVEKKKEAIRCIQKNLQKTKLENQAILYPSDVMEALEQLKKNGKKFDIIFMDPPYHNNLEKKALNLIHGADLLAENGWLIVEASIDTNVDYMESYHFTIEKIKKYKTNMHVFLKNKLK